jgi:glycosyltransferase involved in cell wall biosynthesis
MTPTIDATQEPSVTAGRQRRPLNILQVSTFFKPSWEAGGIARVSYDVAKRLADRHAVVTYTTDGFKRRLDVPTNRPVEDEGMTIHYFRNLSTWLASHNAALPYALPFRARTDVQNYDVVHVHTVRTALGVAVCHYARKHGVPYVIETHGTLAPKYSKLRSKRLFDRLFGRRILAGATKVIALNQTEATHYESYGVEPERIEIVPNGLDSSEYAFPPREETTFRDAYSIPDDDQIVLYIGRLHESKGLDLLVDSFRLLHETNPDATLVIVGPDDGAEAALREQVANAGLDESVVFAGYVSWTEKLAALATADVFVTPRFTGFPMTFLEACAAGVPVVTTFVEEELGWVDDQVGLVSTYDAASFSTAMRILLNDDRLRARCGETGTELVDGRFSWGAVVAQLEELYEDCLAPRS